MTSRATRVRDCVFGPDPFKNRPYLVNPAYYQVGYQLIAIQANHRAHRSATTTAKADDARVPVEQASDLFQDVAFTIAMFEAQAGRWRPWCRPSDQDRRLWTFLVTTVRPCLEMATEGLELLHPTKPTRRQQGTGTARPKPEDWKPWEDIPPPAISRRQWLRSTQKVSLHWSFRSLYNLACFESMRSKVRDEPLRVGITFALAKAVGLSGPQGSESRPVALWALNEAFRMAGGLDRAALIAHAQDDPSLAYLRTSPTTQAEFRATVARYSPKPKVKPGKPSILKVGPKRKADPGAKPKPKRARWRGPKSGGET